MKGRKNIRSRAARINVPVAIAAAIFVLAVGTAGVYGVQSRASMTAAAAGGGTCEPKYKNCMQQEVPQKKKTPQQCEQEFQKCVLIDNKCAQKTAISVGQTCNKAPDCQAHCTESATSKGAILSCCKGGAKHVNTCPDEVDGKCNPKKKELGKQGEEKKGGEPKMPELPKPPEGKGGAGGQPPAQQPCPADSNAQTQTVNPTAGAESRPDCPPKTTSALSGLLNIFSPDRASGASADSQAGPSAFERISAIFSRSGDAPAASSDNQGVQNEAVRSGDTNTSVAFNGGTVAALNPQTGTSDQDGRETSSGVQQNSLSTGFSTQEENRDAPQSVTMFSSLVTQLRAALAWLQGL